MPGNRYLLNDCDRSCLYGWSAAWPANRHNATHVELFSAPDPPWLLTFEGPREASGLVCALGADGLGTLDVHPFVREEQVAQGAVSVGAALAGEDEGLLYKRGASHVDVD